MRTRWKIVIGLVLLAAACIIAGLWAAEIGYQKSADAKRLNDVRKIAELLEAYRAKTGRLPLEAEIGRQQSSALTVIICAPEAEQSQVARGNPLGQEPPSPMAPTLLASLRSELGPEVRLPIDPQRGATGAPNAYYVRFKGAGQYLVAGFLRRPTPSAATFAPGVFSYALRSSKCDWCGQFCGHARVVAQMPPEEGEEIRKAGDRADAKFSRYMKVTVD